MQLPSPLRGALIAGVLATILNRLFLTAEALLLYGSGLLTPRPSFFLEDNANNFIMLGTIFLCIPELIGGLVFGAVFMAIGKGGRCSGLIAGAIL